MNYKSVIESIKAKVSISKVIGKYVKLHQKGHGYTGLCPFHHEKTPSFTVNDQKGFYHCFGCGAHGDVLKFLTDNQNYNFNEAVSYLGQQVGIKYTPSSNYGASSGQVGASQGENKPKYDHYYKIMAEITQFYHQQLFSHSASSALSYLQNRGLSDDTITKFRLGWAPNGPQQREFLAKFDESDLETLGVYKNSIPKFRSRIIFPIFDKNDRVIAFGGRILEDNGGPKYLNSPETPIFHKGYNLYGQNFAKMERHNTIIVCEGYMDTIALHQAGFNSGVAPLGTSITDEQVTTLLRMGVNGRAIVFCFDGDNAGMRAAVRAAYKLIISMQPTHQVKFILLPKGCDPDNYIKQNGRNNFEAMLKLGVDVFELIWQTIIGGKSRDDVSHKAQITAQINEVTSQMTDFALKASVKEHLRGRMYSWLRFKGKQDDTPQGTVNFNSIMIREFVLLCTIVEHPKILDEHLEKLQAISFTGEQNQQLQSAIIDYYHECGDQINKQGLIEYIKNSGLNHILDLMQSSQIKVHCMFIKGQDLDKVVEKWLEIYQTNHEIDLQKDLQKAKEALNQEVVGNNWQRLQEITKLVGRA